jgi:hypothetical protein
MLLWPPRPRRLSRADMPWMAPQRFGSPGLVPRIRGADPDRTNGILPLPLYYHPVIACSLILIVAAAVQIGVWLVSMKLPAQAPGSRSFVVVHGVLLDALRGVAFAPGNEDATSRPAWFIAGLLLALSSGLTWYAVARFGLGPKWGLWTGLFWVVHPSFAFLANQPDKLTLLIALIPAAWCALLWWRRCPSTWVALLLGATLAATCLAGFQGILLLVIALPAMLLSKLASGGHRFAGAAAAVLGLAITLSVSVAGIIARQVTADLARATSAVQENRTTASRPSGMGLAPSRPVSSNWMLALTRLSTNPSGIRPSPSVQAGWWLWLARENLLSDVRRFLTRLDHDLWNALDDGSGTAVANAARKRMGAVGSDRPDLAPHLPPAVYFLADEYRQAPRDVGRWFVGRFWRTIYASRDGRVLYSLAVLQFAWLVPALWGFWIALAYRPWRWLAVSAGLFVVAYWVLVALAEPLAGNLTPVGGFGVMFALVGVTDVYERLFGRRLTAPAPASRSARLRRVQRNLRADPPL